MSRTFKFDPYAENQSAKYRFKRNFRNSVIPDFKVDEEFGEEESFVVDDKDDKDFSDCWDYKAHCINRQWADVRMTNLISKTGGSLVRMGFLDQGDFDEYVDESKRVVQNAISVYDPTRVGRNGRPATPYTFLSRVIVNHYCNVKKALLYRRRYFRRCPIVWTHEEKEGYEYAIHAEGILLSDRCKTINELFLKMDKMTLFSMLSHKERFCLKAILSGYSQAVISQAISNRLGRVVDRYHVAKVVLPKIREKARLCGFFPPSEAKK